MKENKVYLQDILDTIVDIKKFIQDINEEDFYKNREKQYAIIRALEIIEEATKKLSKELKKEYYEIPWRDIAGMRDKLIHDYFGINLELVWETVNNQIPELEKTIIKILKTYT